MRYRLGAAGLAAGLAVATVVGGVALQRDGGPPAQQDVSTTTIEDEPILYPGGWGLYPVVSR